MSEPKAHIFDCDGTLVDTMPIHYLAWRDTFSGYGLQFSEDQHYSMGGTPPAKVVQLLATEQGQSVDARRVADEKENLFLQMLDKVEPIRPVVDFVHQFHGHCPLAVASGSTRDVVAYLLEQTGLAAYFDTVVTAEDTERHKPEPDVFLIAAERLGVSPTECRVYEDSDLGIEAAKRAGMSWFDVRTVHTPKRWGSS